MFGLLKNCLGPNEPTNGKRCTTGFAGVTKQGNLVPASIALDCLYLPDYGMKVATAILAENAIEPKRV